LLSGASPDQRQQFREFGLAFGTAYQVFDDCVDLFGSEIKAGKSLGTDLAKGKLTLPLLVAWEQADATDRAELKVLVQTFEPGSMHRIGYLLEKYQTLSASVTIIRQYLERARHVLRSLPLSDGRAGLLGLADYLARQTDALAAAPASNL